MGKLILMDEKQLIELQNKATQIRELIIKMLTNAGSGHPGGALGMADIFSAMYFHVLKHNPKNPLWEDRDRLVLSNGHICPVQYATLALAGYFDIKELDSLRKINSKLQGHPKRGSVGGLETTSGPLGEGLSQAIGMAFAAQLDSKDHTIFCVTSDGEHEEGNTWEAVMLAGKYKLGNLVNIIDRNNIQIDGYTENIMPLEPLSDKYRAFNWEVLEVDGNNIREFVDACFKAKAIFNKPTVIIAHTIPGKGVDFMEKNYLWHGKAPNEDEARIALSQLKNNERLDV